LIQRERENEERIEEINVRGIEVVIEQDKSEFYEVSNWNLNCRRLIGVTQEMFLNFVYTKCVQSEKEKAKKTTTVSFGTVAASLSLGIEADNTYIHTFMSLSPSELSLSLPFMLCRAP